MKVLLAQQASLRVHSLDGYLNAVRQMPILCAEEEKQLAQQVYANHDVAAARKMMISHLRLVAHIAWGYHGYGLPQEDLIQEGNIGLMKAIAHFEPQRNVRFAAFAIHWIRAEIIEFIVENFRLVKIATTKAQRKLFFNLRRLKSDTGWAKAHEISRIAETLEVPVHDVREMEMRLSGADARLDAVSEDPARAPFELPANEADPGELLMEKDATERQSAALKQALVQLDDRSRHIIEARWLTEGKKTTLQRLAAQYGVTAEGVRKIEQRALQQLRSVMQTAVVTAN